VGTTPPNYNPDSPNYHNIDILNLIVFYNDNFGTGPLDTLGGRVEKFQLFSTDANI
jgi:hypothetical protein